MSGELDMNKENYLLGRYEKQMLCIAHGKRCADCDGKDEYGTDCKFYERQVGKSVRKTENVIR